MSRSTKLAPYLPNHGGYPAGRLPGGGTLKLPDRHTGASVRFEAFERFLPVAAVQRLREPVVQFEIWEPRQERQISEREAHNRLVGGSIPPRPTEPRPELLCST